MQSKQLYIGRKIHPKGGDQRKRELERESEHCKIERHFPEEQLFLGEPKEGLK